MAWPHLLAAAPSPDTASTIAVCEEGEAGWGAAAGGGRQLAAAVAAETSALDPGDLLPSSLSPFSPGNL